MSDLRVVWLDIEGFRRFRERRFFDFRDPGGKPLELIVLAGTNGSGKTTLMEAILFALGLEGKTVSDIPTKERKAHWRGKMPPEARLAICVEQGGTFFRADRKGGSVIHWVALAQPLDAVGTYADVRVPATSMIEYFSSWRAPALTGPVWPTTGGLRPLETEANRLQNLKQRLVDQFTVEAYADASAVDTAHPNQNAHGRWLEAINRAWTLLHGGDGTRLADQPVGPGDAKAGFDLFVLERDGHRRCSVDHLSAGEIEILTLAGSLITRKPPQLILIDEPELHLHPQWQSQIIPALRSLVPDAQLFVSTHADAPWDRAPSYGRFFLGSEGDPRTTFGRWPVDMPPKMVP